MRLIKILSAAFAVAVLLWGLPGLATFNLDDANSTFAAQQGKDGKGKGGDKGKGQDKGHGKGQDKGNAKGKGKGGEYPPPPKGKGKGKDGRGNSCNNPGNGNPPHCQGGGFNQGESVSGTASGPSGQQGALGGGGLAVVTGPLHLVAQGDGLKVWAETALTADANGRVLWDVALPDAAPSGAYRVLLVGQDSGNVVQLGFDWVADGSVTGATGTGTGPGDPAPSGLARAGQYVTNGLVLGLGLLLAGASIVYGVRRSREWLGAR